MEHGEKNRCDWRFRLYRTVGYGDLYPVTTVGRLAAIVSSLFGVAFAAMPAGIITAGYMEELNMRTEQNREKDRGQESKKKIL